MTPRRRHTLAQVLGPLEQEVMDVVWNQGEVTVRDVYKALRKRRPIAYTTVMTTMSRLAEKDLLHREENQRAHRFSALISRDDYAASTVESVVDWLVDHFREPAVAYFLDRVERDDEAMVELLRRAIDERKVRRGRE